MPEEDTPKDSSGGGGIFCCCGSHDKRPFIPPKEVRRGCSDKIFLLAIIAVWVIMTFIGMVATGAIESPTLKAGRLEILQYPFDNYGRLCGVDAPVRHKKNGYFMPTGLSVCVADCPSEFNVQKFVCDNDAVPPNTTSLQWSAVLSGTCMWEMNTFSYQNRCIATKSTTTAQKADVTAAATAAIGSSLAAKIQDTYIGTVAYNSWLQHVNAMLYTNMATILGFGIGLAVVLAFAYTVVLRIPGVLFTVIWVMLLSLLVLLFVGGGLALLTANSWVADKTGKHSDTEILMTQIGAYICFVLGALYLCLLIFIRSRVQLAIGVIKEAGHAITDMMMMLLMPLIQVIGLIAFCAPWVVYMLYLGCSGEVTTVTAKYNDVEYTYIDYVFEQSTYGAFAFMLFVFFWTTQLIIALGQVMIALAVSSWYFSRERALSGTPTVIWATLASLQHVGTAAAGSLLIAICKMIRAVIHYFQKQAAKYPGNACCKALLCMCGCCVWCLEGCIKFLNKNAYIMTALYGYGFCRAASKAFSVLAANIVRVLTVNFISSFVLLLGKMLIPVASSFFAYIVLEYTGTEPTGLFFPVIVVFILAYFVACMFNEIYDMSIETILICFCEDESLFEPGERYAPASLRATIKDTNQKAASNRVAPTPVEAVDAKEFASDPQPAASSDETGFLT